MAENFLKRYRITWTQMKMSTVWGSSDDEAIAALTEGQYEPGLTSQDIGGPEILDIEEIAEND